MRGGSFAVPALVGCSGGSGSHPIDAAPPTDSVAASFGAVAPEMIVIPNASAYVLTVVTIKPAG